MSLTVRTVAYQGWKNCCRISNGKIELIVTTDVGPRVIRFGFVGGQNLFKEYPAQLGKRGGKTWRIYGGHRLWHAPEDASRTYFPDNSPVSVEKHGQTVRFVAPVETNCGIQKEMDITLGSSVKVVHRLRNTGAWDIEVAPWALTVMNTGGTCVIPLPKRGTHPEDLLPGNLIVPWLYTDMSDPRWTWGRKYILLRENFHAAKTRRTRAGRLGRLRPRESTLRETIRLCSRRELRRLRLQFRDVHQRRNARGRNARRIHPARTRSDGRTHRDMALVRRCADARK
jgi:hypothetical protein